MKSNSAIIQRRSRGTGRGGSLRRALPCSCAVATLVLANLVRAEELRCPASTSEEARSLADQLLQAGRYESAGKCYEAAGEYARANEAFLKAAGAESKAAERENADHIEAAKNLARQLERAFRGPPRGAE